jgi:predicted phage terminase large subunit-like protein
MTAAVAVQCQHEHAVVYARRLVEGGGGLAHCEHICDDCGARWWSEGIAAQEGPQTAFVSSRADITFYGGGAGSSKTYGALLRHIPYLSDPRYNGIIFRRTSPELTGGPDALFSVAMEHYRRFGARVRYDNLSFRFPSGAFIRCSHLQHEKDVYAHQGQSYTGITLEELTHYTEMQVWYLISRMRSLSGVDPFLDATMNPVPKTDPVGGWVRRMIDYWIDEDGYAIRERSGVIRYFVRVDDVLMWADDPAELVERYPGSGKPKSFTFISANLDDNKILKEGDPSYEANLMSLQRVERERLRKGNWNVTASAGLYFQRGFFTIVERPPAAVIKRVRGWDVAASKPTAGNPDPSWTRGVKMSLDTKGRFYVEDVVSLRGSPAQNHDLRLTTAKQDGPKVVQAFWQDPGGAGKDQATNFKTGLPGFSVRTVVAREDKITYASPVSTQAEAGNVYLVRGPWNEAYLAEHEAFPEAKHKDIVDAESRAFLELANSAGERWKRALQNK